MIVLNEEDKQLLRAVVDVLIEHKKDMMPYPLEKQNPLALANIIRGDSSKENLKKILIFSCQWRGGPRLNVQEMNAILKQFDNSYDVITEEILPNFDGQKSTDKIYEQLTNINGLGSKTVGVYLRDLAVHFDIWNQLLPYLYQPVDKHIRALLAKDYYVRLSNGRKRHYTGQLQIFEDEDIPKPSESFFSSRKNRNFQKILLEIHSPRVDFDGLWFVGANFCSFRKMCPLCWIRDFCKNRFEDADSLRL